MKHGRQSAQALMSALLGICLSAVSWSSPPPNIVLIVTDDQNTSSFGAYGGRVHTPHIDKLAEEGLLFRSAYAVTSVCSPSRYAILTGRYPGRCTHPRFNIVSPPGGIARISNKSIGMTEKEPNLIRALNAKGYRTGIVGKWHLGRWMAGWKENGVWRFPPGFHQMGLRSYPADAALQDPDLTSALAHNQEVYARELKKFGWDHASAIYWCNPRELHHDQLFNHNQEWMTAGALDFIRESTGQPFFLYLATTLAHSPPPQDTLDRGDDARATGGGWQTNHLDSQPPRDSLPDRVSAAGAPAETTYLTWLDDGIGAIVDLLKARGLRDNTLIILTSDHGLDGKATLYQSGVQVPLILNWPGRIPSGIRKDPVQHIDLAPTLNGLLGLPVPPIPFDGEDLHVDRSLEKPRQPENPRSLYFEYGYARAIHYQHWKYIAVRYPPGVRKAYEEGVSKSLPYLGHNRSLGKWQAPNFPDYFTADQLYNLQDDPGEQRNLADKPAYQEILATMKAMLRQHLEYAPDRPFGEFTGP